MQIGVKSEQCVYKLMPAMTGYPKLPTKEERDRRLQTLRTERVASVRTRQKVFVRFGVVLLLSGLWVVVRYVIPELRVRLRLSGWGISVTGQQ